MKRKPIKYKYNAILLLDDSELDNFINEKTLESVSFAKKIYVSTNGKSALEFINNLIVSGGAVNGTYPDVMFVDLNMPIMGGFEFIERLKKLTDEKLKECKIIILTSSIDGNDRIKAQEIIKDVVFLNKPLTEAMLSLL